MVGITRHDLDHVKRLIESDVSVDHRISLDEIEASMSFNRSCTTELFGTPEIQKASESWDATDERGDAQDVPTMEDPTMEQESEDGDSASLYM